MLNVNNTGTKKRQHCEINSILKRKNEDYAVSLENSVCISVEKNT
jgi:hypothetical protein